MKRGGSLKFGLGVMTRRTRVTPTGRNGLTRCMWMPHYGVARRLESIVEVAQKHEGNNEEMIQFPEGTFVVIR
jgi:hypothetical protein